MDALEIKRNNQKFINDVISKANEDASFKQELLADPEKTLRAFNAKFRMPNGWNIVVQDHEDSVFIDFASPIDVELTTEELELVAGGSCWVSDNDVSVDTGVDVEVDTNVE